MILRSLILTLALAGTAWGMQAKPAAAACEGDGKKEFICGPINAEDETLVPGTPWVITSGYSKPGHLYLIDSRDKSASVLYPGETPQARPDTKTYPDCPGPIDPSAFGAHGIHLTTARKGVRMLYAVNHATRESIEVFELRATKAKALVVWVGCVVLPQGMTGNAVAPLPEGGFVATNFRAVGETKFLDKVKRNEPTGDIQEWHPGKGWSKVPGSEISGPNGIETSADGKTLYICDSGKKSIARLSRGKTPIQHDDAVLDFFPDNVKSAPDGSLLVGGIAASLDAFAACSAKPGCMNPVGVARVDPKTLKVTNLINDSDNAVFGSAATAIQVGNEIWVGPSRGDRIARYKVK